MLTRLLEDQFVLLDRFVQEQPTEVADLGAGLGHHCRRFVEHGIRVVAVDRVLTPALAEVLHTAGPRHRFVGADVGSLPFEPASLGAIWASHCLEHDEDLFGTLREWRRVLVPEGMLAVLVPPYKTEVVGRHVVTGWNAGQLMLTLFRAGFRVRDGVFARQGYNIFAMVRKCENLPRLQPNDEILHQYHEHFPASVEQEILQNSGPNTFGETVGRFNGDLVRLGW